MEFVKRPWSEQELARLAQDIGTHGPVHTLVNISPVWRKRARVDLDIDAALLAEILGITEEQLLAFESEEMLVSDETNATYRAFIAASSVMADAIRPPDRVVPAASVPERQPVNPPKRSKRETDAAEAVMG